MAKAPDPRIRLQAQRLRECRAETGLSQSEVETRLESRIKKPALANYERARRAIGPEEAEILGTLYGVPSSYLLAVDEEMEPLTKQERQLIKDFRELPGKERAEYARRIGALAAVYRDAVPDETVERRIPAPSK